MTRHAHHWLLSSTETVPLRGKQAVKNEGCVGRVSVCRVCGVRKILPERLYDVSRILRDTRG